MKRLLIYVCLAYTFILMPSCKKDLSIDNLVNKEQSVEAVARISRCNTDHRMDLLYQNRPGYRSEILEGRRKEMLNLETRNPT